jgi:hypothetical protein
MPRDILLNIDRLRGDASRRKFLLLLVEKALGDKEVGKGCARNTYQIC